MPKFCCHYSHPWLSIQHPASLTDKYELQNPNCTPETIRLSELLLDEEGSEMRELPGAGDAKDDKLDDDPADDTGVCRLGLISELGLSLLYMMMWSAF